MSAIQINGSPCGYLNIALF